MSLFSEAPRKREIPPIKFGKTPIPSTSISISNNKNPLKKSNVIEHVGGLTRPDIKTDPKPPTKRWTVADKKKEAKHKASDRIRMLVDKNPKPAEIIEYIRSRISELD
jgi:hypothetical protein